jgi:hypothetical protein
MIVTTYAHTCSGSLLAFSALHHGMHSTLSSGAEEAGVLWRLQPLAYQQHQTGAAARENPSPHPQPLTRGTHRETPNIRDAQMTKIFHD